MYPILRSFRVMAGVLAGAAALCIAGAFILYVLVQASAGEAGIAAWPFVLMAVALWAGLVGVVLYARYSVRQQEARLCGLAADLVNDPESRKSSGVEPHGIERHLYELGGRLGSTMQLLDDQRKLGRTLLQLGEHYALVCTLDGRVVDTNAAFLARAGLSPAQLAEEPATIMEMLRLEPLLDLARRSLGEGASLSGIAHDIVLNGEVRPVQVALRAMTLRNGDAVVIFTMNDHAHEAQLERQIDQFSDAIDLMVDQRVARIAAGRMSVESTLSRAGVALFSFDHSGNTEKLNPAAELLTGRTQFTLQSFTDVARVLVRGDEAVRDLSRWFFAEVQIPRPEMVHTPHGRCGVLLLSGAELYSVDEGRRLLAAVPLPDELAVESPDAEPLRRLGQIALSLNPSDFSPDVRAFVGVIREAVRRLDTAAVASGDGAAGNPHAMES